MQLLPRSTDFQDWTLGQIILTGAAVGILTGLVFAYVTACFLPSVIKDPEHWE